MHWQGINANIMSLGGIAIAIGAMVDGAIVMIENVHKHIERTPLTDKNRWQVIGKAVEEVGTPLFFLITDHYLKFCASICSRRARRKMFAITFTKTYAMAAAAGLAITLVLVLMGYFVRGVPYLNIKTQLTEAMIALYRPLLNLSLKFPKTMIIAAGLLNGFSLYPLTAW